MKLYLTQAKLIGIYFYIHREGLKISEIFRQPPPKKNNALLAKKTHEKIFDIVSLFDYRNLMLITRLVVQQIQSEQINKYLELL